MTDSCIQTDTLIIGSGIAGATAALRLAADRQRQITVITRADHAVESNSKYAQGGVVGRGLADSPELLTADILQAGDGLCNPQAVQILAEEGPDLLHEILIEQAQVPFEEIRDMAQLSVSWMPVCFSTSRRLHRVCFSV